MYFFALFAKQVISTKKNIISEKQLYYGETVVSRIKVKWTQPERLYICDLLFRKTLSTETWIENKPDVSMKNVFDYHDLHLLKA